MTKRKRSAEDTTPARHGHKRRASNDPFQDQKSVRELAKPYLLATARLHIDIMDITWSKGVNRRIEPSHVRELRDVFIKGGLERSAPENHMFVLCDAEDVRRALETRQDDEDGGDEGAREHPLLRWADVNGTKVEVMAGQHRLHALREYIKATGAVESDAWWTCELYDKDKLPPDLNMRLRVNRRDPSLPDNHGQIWKQLVSVASDTAGPSTHITVNHKLVVGLRLSSEKGLPTRRLVTLWNHERWRDMATRWCQTRLGLETFNISTFEWMASLRVDGYWFATLEAVLDTLNALPLDVTQDVGLGDWNMLSTALPASNSNGEARAQDVVEAAFFPTDGCNNTNSAPQRTAGLLRTLDDEAYKRVYTAVSAAPNLSFVDLKRFLRPKRPETETAVRVLHHVVSWIDSRSAAELADVNPKSKNKPLLLEHLQAALDNLSAYRDSTAYAENTAARLQRRVLDLAIRDADAFRAQEVQTLTIENVTLVDKADYGARFSHGGWARVLCVVRGITDAGDAVTDVLRPEWGMPADVNGDLRWVQACTLTNTFCATLFKMSNQPVKNGDPRLLELQRRIEEVLVSFTDLPGLPLFSPAPTAENTTTDDEDDPSANESVGPSPQRRQKRPSPAADVPPPSAQKNTGSREPTGHRAGLSRAEALRVLSDVEGRASSVSPRQPSDSRRKGLKTTSPAV
ncbi:hypothetical protein CGCF415_v015725 [Colletotrichum fructicola]|nr:hypothetical protein CGCF415_v015725 [Colletotrichum fructicola]